MPILKKLILGTPLEGLARFLLNKPKLTFDSSSGYWDRRYRYGGNSGAGSYGRLAEFKAEFINGFVSENKIDTVIEFGCGDGNQLGLASYKEYLGIDVSQKAITGCSELFAFDETKKFLTTAAYNDEMADLALSLDVIYHLVEDDTYESYMSTLFASAERYVIIYSSNYDHSPVVEHVRHRKFTVWVETYAKEFSLNSYVPNKYPYEDSDPVNTSFADFFIFQKNP